MPSAAAEAPATPKPERSSAPFIEDVWYVVEPSRTVRRTETKRLSVCGEALSVTRKPDRMIVAQWPDRAAHALEFEGLIWVYYGKDPNPRPPISHSPPSGKVRYSECVTIPARQDDAAYGLLDPAHTPFVHRSPIWRGSGILKEKTKRFEPNDFGFTMVPHAPVNSDIYNLIGGKISVRIEFRLPGLRAEYIQNKRHTVLGLSALTPIDETSTRLFQIFYWNTPILGFIRPIAPLVAKPFLNQDVEIMRLRRENEPYGGKGMLLGDSDRQFIWYSQIKKEWEAARRERRSFQNPMAATTLRWRT